jgi:membrane protein YqaA with SNARE-associated domain
MGINRDGQQKQVLGLDLGALLGSCCRGWALGHWRPALNTQRWQSRWGQFECQGQ